MYNVQGPCVGAGGPLGLLGVSRALPSGCMHPFHCVSGPTLRLGCVLAAGTQARHGAAQQARQATEAAAEPAEGGAHRQSQDSVAPAETATQEAAAPLGVQKPAGRAGTSQAKTGNKLARPVGLSKVDLSTVWGDKGTPATGGWGCCRRARLHWASIGRALFMLVLGCDDHDASDVCMAFWPPCMGQA